MTTKEQFLEQIEDEFATAVRAMRDGNIGKARVCARRAAGRAITWFLSSNDRRGWGSDAINQLLHLKEDESFPKDIRDAALRLSTKISERFKYPFTSEPIDDARLIVEHIKSRMESFDA